MIHDKCRVHEKVHEPKASYRKSPITQIRPRGRVRYSNRLYRTLAKIRPPFSARSLGLLGDWAFNRERRVFIRIYAHPRPQIEVYTLLYGNSVLIYCIFILIDSMNILLTTTML